MVMVKGTHAHKFISLALQAIYEVVNNIWGKSRVKNVRVLPIPQKISGVLPPIPIFAGLSALEVLTVGVAAFEKAMNDAQI